MEWWEVIWRMLIEMEPDKPERYYAIADIYERFHDPDEMPLLEKAIEEGYVQMRIAERARQRKERIDRGEQVVVGVNAFNREEREGSVGEVFKVNPQVRDEISAKYQRLMDTRDNSAVESALAKLREAAIDDGVNLMPTLIDCCHAYATIGEMVATLKEQWGEFQEPVRL